MNHYRLVLRLLFLFFIGLSATMAAQVFAAEPPGAAPSSAILLNAAASETCTTQTLAPGTQMWFQVPYHVRKDLEIYARGDTSIDWSVFDPRQMEAFPNLGKPVGLLTPNRNEPQYLKSWLGHLWLGAEAGIYSIRATNALASPVTFSLCSAEREQFFPPRDPYPTPVPPVRVCPPRPNGVDPLFVIQDPCGDQE